ncbi:TPA: hypothetical protein ACHBXU_003735 [Klebsiella pneumoniae]
MQSILITPYIKDIQNNNSEMRQCPEIRVHREPPDTREGGGEAEPVNMEAGCVGLQYTIQLQLAVLFMVAMALVI